MQREILPPAGPVLHWPEPWSFHPSELGEQSFTDSGDTKSFESFILALQLVQPMVPLRDLEGQHLSICIPCAGRYLSDEWNALVEVIPASATGRSCCSHDLIASARRKRCSPQRQQG
ncbi:hypothetical protein HRR79_003234 [Exophiala dermatitidis]|nr:hypothetical protein HRR79_003234 [Exophiala dermatitidis]